MSSLSDVQNAMVNVIGPALYPNGYSNPSIANTNIYIAAGDYLKLNLDTLLKEGQIVVAVFAVNGMTRSTTRVRRTYVDDVINPPQLILTTSNNQVTVAGTINPGEAAMVIVNGVGYAVSVQLGSTFNSIADALATQIPNAVATNNVISFTIDPLTLIARVSTQGTSRQILFSRESIMRARVIAPSHELREIVGDAIDLAFGINGYYLPMPDLISASIKPNRIMEINASELANAFMRDYLYLCEYHTVQVGTFQTIAYPYILYNNEGLDENFVVDDHENFVVDENGNNIVAFI